eukprot:jgi/Bigna1/79749/fgenesh1_pg.65_\
MLGRTTATRLLVNSSQKHVASSSCIHRILLSRPATRTLATTPVAPTQYVSFPRLRSTTSLKLWDIRGFTSIGDNKGALAVRGFRTRASPRNRSAFDDDAEEVPETAEEDLFNQTSSGIDYSKYEEIEVSVKGTDPEEAVDTFKGLGIHEKIMRNVDRLGYSDPTPIQKNAVPNAVKGRDIMACAQTGSGKTAAFLIPIMQRILESPHFKPSGPRQRSRRNFGEALRPLALVLTPTRELCRQIHEEARKFSNKSGISVCTAYGGQSRDVQLRAMSRGCDILIATPGRLNDFIQSRAVSMSNICYLALDEADRMLDMGFAPQIEDIVAYSDMTEKGQRQTMVFSATFPSEIQRMAAQYLENYVFITVGRVGSTTDLITQDVRFIQEFEKQDALLQCLPDFKQAIIFCKTKSGVDRLERFLIENRQRVSAIHGDKSQNARDRSLFNFKNGRTSIMVATDVAARGLDIPNVSHVVNYDLPNTIDEYVHRIGRTGRAGKTGIAISFMNHENTPIAKDLLNLLQESKQEVPDQLETLTRMRGRGGGGGRRGGGGGRGYGRRGGGGGRYRDRNRYEDNLRFDNRGRDDYYERRGGGFGGRRGGGMSEYGYEEGGRSFRGGREKWQYDNDGSSDMMRPRSGNSGTKDSGDADLLAEIQRLKNELENNRR